MLVASLERLHGFIRLECSIDEMSCSQLNSRIRLADTGVESIESGSQESIESHFNDSVLLHLIPY